MAEHPRNVALDRALRLVTARDDDDTYPERFDEVTAELWTSGGEEDRWKALIDVLHELVRVASTSIDGVATTAVPREARIYLLGDSLRYVDEEEADDA